MFKNLLDKPIAEVQNQQAQEWEKEDLLHKCVTTRDGLQMENREFIM